MFRLCTTLYDKHLLVPEEKLYLRKAAYGLAVDQGKILLVNTKRTGKLWFPGGAVEKEEDEKQALRREFKEETGIEIEPSECLLEVEHFFYYDPLDDAGHQFSSFYLCKPLTRDAPKDFQVNDFESEAPQWRAVSDLQEDDFQSWGGEVFRLLKDHIEAHGV